MKKKSKVLAVVSLLMMLFILCGCGAEKTETPNEQTEETAAEGVADFKIGMNKLGENYFKDNLNYRCYNFTPDRDGYYCLSATDDSVLETDYWNWDLPLVSIYSKNANENRSIALKDAEDTYYKVFYANKGEKIKIGFDEYDEDFDMANDLPESVYLDYFGNVTSVGVQSDQNDLIVDVDIYKVENGNKTLAVDLPIDIVFSEGNTLTRPFWFVSVDDLSIGEHTAKVEFNYVDYDIPVVLHDYREYIEKITVPESFKGKATRKDLELPETATIYYTDASTLEIVPSGYNEDTLPNNKLYSFGCDATRKGDSRSYTVEAVIYKNDVPYPYRGLAGDSGEQLAEITIGTFDY